MIKEAEEKEIKKEFEALKQSCTNCPPAELERLETAFGYAKTFYGDQRLEKGELKILQSLRVARIVSEEIGLRIISVIAALLHDIIETDQHDFPNDLEKVVGKEIASIIKGFKKISGLHSEKVSLQSENFRSLFLNTVDDIRIIFIKLAHRLYDMRNYHQLPEKLKEWYLDDVRYLYIPIAHRLGLYKIKAELEDFEFKYSNPEEYKQIESKLKESREEQQQYISRFIQPIHEVLINEKMEYELKSRTKTISSIKRKMEKQGVDLDQVYDLFAIRVIINDTLNTEEFEFVEEYERFIHEHGDPRNQRAHKKDFEGNGLDMKAEDEFRDGLAIEKEMKREKILEFEARRKRYLELMHREKTACWKAYSLITNIYSPNPKRLRDWISAPKASGYESLHTTVLGPDKKYVEVQIRTKRMDEHAETGSAAHWRYKESAYGKDVGSWMNDIRNVLENMGAQKLDEGVSSKIVGDSEKIYVFTPKGDLRELRKGATVLDFAFDIHTLVGSHCTGGRINKKVVPIRHTLSNGDRVEIITSKKQKPNIDWLKYVVTSKAKTRINRALREEKFKDAESGKETLMRRFKNWKIELNDKNISKMIKYYNLQKPVDLYFNIAVGKIDINEIRQIFQTMEVEEIKPDPASPNFELTSDIIESQSEKDQGFILIESGVSNLNYSLAKCCNPIAGDRIFGFVTVNKGIKIHRTDCPNAKQLLKNYPYRRIETRWKETRSTQFFITNLKIVGSDRLGLINDITKIISNDLKVNMKDIRFNTKGDVFEGYIKVQIRDVEHLGFLKQKLLKVKGIDKITRFDEQH
jgi:GTP pyrophosphokinase